MKFLLTLGLGFVLGIYVHVRITDKAPLLPDMSGNSSSSSTAPPAKSSAGSIVHGVAKGSQHI